MQTTTLRQQNPLIGLRTLLLHHVTVMLVYLLAAIIITWPLVTVMDSHLFGGFLTDAYQSSRHIWWIKHALQTGQPVLPTLLVYYVLPVTGIFFVYLLITRQWAWPRRALPPTLAGGLLMLVLLLPLGSETVRTPQIISRATGWKFHQSSCLQVLLLVYIACIPDGTAILNWSVS